MWTAWVQIFSAQKGVAGIPVHFLVNTYKDLDPSAEPVHRAVCNIKVLRDQVCMNCVCLCARTHTDTQPTHT